MDTETLFENIPENGTIGNSTLRVSLGWDESRYDAAKKALVEEKKIRVGRGRGGSVYRTTQSDLDQEDEIPEIVPSNGVDLYDPILAATVNEEAVNRVLRVLRAVYPKTTFVYANDEVKIQRSYPNVPYTEDVINKAIAIAQAAL